MARQDFLERVERIEKARGARTEQQSIRRSRQAPRKSWTKTKIFVALIVALVGWYAVSDQKAVPREGLRVNPAIAVTLQPLQTVQLDTMPSSLAIPGNWRAMTHAELLLVDETLSAGAQDDLTDLTGFISGPTYGISDFTLAVSRDLQPATSAMESADLIETVFAGIGWLSAVTGTKVEILQSATPIDQHGDRGAQISIWTEDNGRQDITQMRFIYTAEGQLLVLLSWRAGIVDSAEMTAILDTLRLD